MDESTPRASIDDSPRTYGVNESCTGPTQRSDAVGERSSTATPTPPLPHDRRSPAGAVLPSTLEARNSSDIRREELEIENEILWKNIGPELSDDTKREIKSLFEQAYLKPESLDIPEAQVKLTLTVDNLKQFICKHREFTETEAKNLKNILKSLEEKKIIRRSDSKFNSRMNLTKDNSQIYIDFKNINKRTESDKYPLPYTGDKRVKTVLENNKKYFTLIRLEDPYYNVDIEEESKKYTSFLTPFGLYEFNKMPRGLKTAPAQFQRFMNKLLSELIETEDVTPTMEGMIIATTNVKRHMELLEKTFKLFACNGIVMALDECVFLHKEIEYLEFRISKDGIRPSRRGLEPIINFCIYTGYKKIRSFLGLCKKFKKFIAGYTTIAGPLIDLLKKETPLKYEDIGEKELEAVESLKRSLTSSPTLAPYNNEDETELHCDASPGAFGAVLMQRKEDNELHPIFFFSQPTSDTEKGYNSAMLELYAVGHAAFRFFPLLHGIEFTICTDCQSIVKMLNDKKFPAIFPMQTILNDLEYKAEYRPREDMEHADALSRFT